MYPLQTFTAPFAFSAAPSFHLVVTASKARLPRPTPNVPTLQLLAPSMSWAPGPPSSLLGDRPDVHFWPPAPSCPAICRVALPNLTCRPALPCPALPCPAQAAVLCCCRVAQSQGPRRHLLLFICRRPSISSTAVAEHRECAAARRGTAWRGVASTTRGPDGDDYLFASPCPFPISSPACLCVAISNRFAACSCLACARPCSAGVTSFPNYLPTVPYRSDSSAMLQT
ncbi:uncharacterized protein J3D65DRAFT_100671 [Phyllosticta citribraziliensis]|uniref:Uncharacterized protein n=1 Tax=Phyllosticta citribraziliensis TaxID=989973 RepID=A0ABR1LAL7_9PEZI